MNGHKTNYDFGNKNQWRRWKWNRIHELLTASGVKPRDAVVLYLAGKENLDVEVAQRHGFRQCNMIACDTNKDVVSQLRARGVICVNMDIFEAAKQWGDNPKIDVIDADLCRGLMGGEMLHATTLPFGVGLGGCVLSINMLKGRDSASNRVRYLLACNNRAEAFFSTMHYSITHGIKLKGYEQTLPTSSADMERRKGSVSEWILAGYYQYEYKSSNQVMQSGVGYIPASANINFVLPVNPFLSAAKAVRTTRLQKAA